MTRSIVINDEPERGMTHSLRLANSRIDADRSIIVLPADMPFLDERVVRLVVDAAPSDVAYPLVGKRPGHPVRLGPAARERLCKLPEGDTLRELRDDPKLRHNVVGMVSPLTQCDIDTALDLFILKGPLL